MSEVSTQMTIPKIINVGYQEREDTYTGKLAYVVYTDEKGVLRKEKSWRGWIKQEFGEDKFDNVPTNGFVLNKQVGGTRWSWNHRREKVRVYDPRNFEFEISVDNLLYILQESTSVKGKGLEGDFVYAWDGSELILLPVCGSEYKDCVAFTENKSLKVDKKDIVEGHTYQMKDMTNVLYLGKHHWSEKNWYKRYDSVGPRHIFLNIDKSVGQDKKYLPQQGFTKLAKKISSDIPTNFLEEHAAFLNSAYNSEFIGVELVKKEITLEMLTNTSHEDTCYGTFCFLVKRDGEYYPVKIDEEHNHRYYRMYGGKYGDGRSSRKQFNLHKAKSVKLDLNVKDYKEAIPKFVYNEVPNPNASVHSGYYGRTMQEVVNVDFDDLIKEEYYTINAITTKGSYNLLAGGFKNHY